MVSKDDELKAKIQAHKDMLKFLANMTGDPEMFWHIELIEFDEMLDKIGESTSITKEQYKELTNVIQQFEKMLKDYIRENNIELGGE